MQQRWRLMNGTDLYDLRNDPAQRNNIAAKHPDRVASLRQDYEKWWASVSPGMKEPCRIEVGTKHENPMMLTSQDWYMPIGNPPWNQSHARKAPMVIGPWMIDVKHAGDYRITLRRQAPQAKFKLEATKARIKVANVDKTINVKSGSTKVVFNVKLETGPTQLKTWLMYDNGKSRGAFYVEVERVD
jgi:hypothetical protein